MKPLLAWLRRQLTWSNSRRSWYERIALLTLAATGAGGWWVSGDWAFESQLLLIGLWLILFAVLLRRGIVRLAGPVFFFEVLRGSRRRVHLVRTLFLLILFLTIAYIWFVTDEQWSYHDINSQIRRQSDIARALFGAYFGIQILVIGVVTPVMVAGAIADEKERRTLEFVLATDLRSREIVLGKLAARVANMLLILLAGLPVLGILQFFGGIDPGELLVAFAVTMFTLVSVASLSILMSAVLRRGRDAILSTYLLMAAYLVLSGLAQLGIGTDFGNASIDLGNTNVSGDDLIEAFGAGNPIVGTASIVEQLDNGSGFVAVLRDFVREYSLFHVATSFICIGWAAARLRPVALGQGDEGRRLRRLRKRKLPELGHYPMIWKELFVEPGPRFHLILRFVIFLLVIASFWPPIQITAEHWDRLTGNISYRFYSGYRDSMSERDDNEHNWRYYREEMNAWVRGMSSALGMLLLLGVAVRAAGSITGERSRQTLDDLLATRLSNREIIHGKWLGAILGMRRGLLWLGAVYLVGLATGGLNFFAGVFTILAWFCFACFFASLGLWFSAASRNTFRATTLTIICSIFCLFLHWAVTALCCFLPLGFSGVRWEYRDEMEWLQAIQAGFTPPFTLGALPHWEVPAEHEIRLEVVKFALGILIGLAGFGLAGWGLLRATVVRFALTYNRMAVRHPEPLSAKPPTSVAKQAKPSYTE
jgi:ABC-type transport system involved in multi-copper enzyme maturation permease subunit